MDEWAHEGPLTPEPGRYGTQAERYSGARMLVRGRERPILRANVGGTAGEIHPVLSK